MSTVTHDTDRRNVADLVIGDLALETFDLHADVRAYRELLVLSLDRLACLTDTLTKLTQEHDALQAQYHELCRQSRRGETPDYRDVLLREQETEITGLRAQVARCSMALAPDRPDLRPRFSWDVQ